MLVAGDGLIGGRRRATAEKGGAGGFAEEGKWWRVMGCGLRVDRRQGKGNRGERRGQRFRGGGKEVGDG
jgi:hypothetical protein